MNSQVIKVDRTTSIDEQIYPLFGKPRDGKEWKVWRGKPDSDGLTGERDENPESLRLREINFGRVEFSICREMIFSTNGGKEISGEDKLRILKSQPYKCLLDAQIGFSLWFEDGHRTLIFLKRVRKMKYVEFYGTIFWRYEEAGPSRYVFVLYYADSENGWKWCYRPLRNMCHSMHNVAFINNFAYVRPRK